VKVLPPSFATDPDRLRRFEQEARAAGARKDSHMLNPFTLAHRSDLDSSRFGSGQLQTHGCLDLGAAIRMLLFAYVSSFVLLAVAPAFAEEQPPDWSKIQLKATKVAGSVYMIDMVEGSGGFAGGNVGVSVGSDGIVLVDAMFAPLAPKILAVLTTLSDKPVRFVINTHVHRDHTAALPIITVNDRLTLHQNGEDIRVFHLPHAHSDTDVVVYFKQSNVVHMGDMFFSGMFSFIGRGGSVEGLIVSIQKVLSEIPASAKVIPGHGPLSNTAELRSTRYAEGDQCDC
jgi:glyoxylase-like metal-dependent hydrolase (beta-lactamase superfamily II)